MASDLTGAPPQASIDLDVGESLGNSATPPLPIPANSTQIAAELCTFREDVHGLRRDQRGMTDRLITGQEAVIAGQESVVERLDALIAGNTTIVGLLDRIADSSHRMADEMDKLEDVMRERVRQEDEHLRRGEA